MEDAHNFISFRLTLIRGKGGGRLIQREANDTQNAAALRRGETGALKSKPHRFCNNVLTVSKGAVAIKNDKNWAQISPE